MKTLLIILLLACVIPCNAQRVTPVSQRVNARLTSTDTHQRAGLRYVMAGYAVATVAMLTAEGLPARNPFTLGTVGLASLLVIRGAVHIGQHEHHARRLRMIAQE